MARDIESLVLTMSADLRKFEKQMARMSDVANKRLTAVEAQARASQRNLTRIMERAGLDMASALKRSLADIAPTLAAAFSAGQIIQYADAWTQGRNALAAAGVATSDLAKRQSEIVDLANDTRSSFETTIGLYRRLKIANEELGRSDQDILRLTELMNKSFQTSGSSAQEAASAALQLSQALASGVLQGDELRSIRENAPQIAQAIAKAMGVSIGELKKLGAEGKITADIVASAIIAAGSEIDAKFAATEMTVSQALTKLNNNIGKFIGQANSGLSATDRMAQAISGLADNLDTIVPVVLTLAGVLGTNLVLSLTAAASAKAVAAVATARLTAFQIAMTASMTGATRAQVALNMAMAANPVGLVVTAVAALAGGLFLLIQRYNSTAIAQRQLAGLQSAAEGTLGQYRQAVLDAANASDKERKALQDKANALRQVTQERINDMRVAAMQQRIEADNAKLKAEEARKRADQYRSSSQGAGWSNARAAQVGGNDAAAAGAESYARRADEEATKAEAEVSRLQRELREAQNTKPPVVDILGGAPKDDGKNGRNDAERQAEMRAELALQLEIDKARAAGDEAAIKAAERKKDLADLTARYEAAGYANAVELAATHQGYVDAAEDDVEAKRKAAEAAQKLQQIFDDIAAKQKAEAELQRDRVMDQLGYQAELARAWGDETAIKNAERRLFIEQRTLEILRLKLAATEAEARAMAGGEYDTLDHADEARNSAQTIVSVLRSDNIWEEAGRRFKDAAWDGFEQMLSQIIGAMTTGGSGGDGNWLQAIAGLFTGGRKAATGRSVTAGYPVLTGERRPEVFVPSVSGTIIPNVNQAMSRMQGRALAQPQSFTVVVNANDAVLTETVKGWVSDGMRQAVSQSVSTSANLGRRAMPDLQHKQRRLGTA